MVRAPLNIELLKVPLMFTLRGERERGTFRVLRLVERKRWIILEARSRDVALAQIVSQQLVCLL